MQTQRLIKATVAVIVVGMVVGLKSVWGVNNWIQLDDGLVMGQVYALAAHESRLYAGSENGVFVSGDGGNSWVPTSFNDSVSTLTVDEDTVYAGTWSQGVFRSDDAGVTWKPIRDGLRLHEHAGERYYGNVRHILVTDNNIINVMYHSGTYTLMDRGETWHDISTEWMGGNSIHSMTEFGGYLWSAVSNGAMFRSPDNGKTWENLPRFAPGHVHAWAALNGRLYVGGYEGVGVWNETTRSWEYPMAGLPIGNHHQSDALPYVLTLVVHGDQLFAGLHDTHGVYVFDLRSGSWSPTGLEGRSVGSLLSHGSALYAGTAEDGIYYLAKITAISPQEGNVEGGEPITFFGRGFPPRTTVTIGGRSLTDIEVTNTLITGFTPPGVLGEADIEVHFPDSDTLTLERWKFLYTNTPSITLAMTPTNGHQAGGETGIVTGSSFAPGAIVKIGDNSAIDTIVTPTLIHFTIPPGSVGTVAVTVTNPDGREQILEKGYTYDLFPPPVIREIYPNKGPIDGGTEVIVRGNYFLEGATVIIGGIQIEHLDSFSPIEIRLETPPSTPGHKEIRVVNPDGQQVVQEHAFTYNAPLDITSITPNVGPMEGGTLVTITGTGFRSSTGDTKVTIGGIAVSSITDMSLTEMIVRTPPTTTSRATDVILRNPNGEEVTLIDGFTYTDSLAVEPKGKLLTALGLVKQTRLLQNYPNPFNPETWIPYQLATETDVTVVIYNSAGQRVRTLELGSQPPGLYLTQEKAAYWDGRSDTGEWVSSGTYFYHLHTGSYSAAKKMIILK